jgi:phage I-like protein
MQLQILNDFPLPRIGANAPTEIVLFKWGENLTTKGTKYLTKSGADQIMATYNQGGRILNIDLEHSTFDKSVRPQDRFSVGHFRLALKDIGIVATDIQWVDGWDEKISRGEWTFFSPAVMETAEGEIVSIRNIALTNLPATQNQTPLCLSDIETMRQAETQPKLDIVKNQSLLSRTKPAKDMLAAIGSCVTSAQSAMSADSTLKEAAAELIAALPTVTQ